MTNIRIHQIFYDWPTRRQTLPGFIPLDNSQNKRPDWFELWSILEYLEGNTLEDDCWYGFLSPKFSEKSGFNAGQVFRFIEARGQGKNVALFSPGWDQLAYFKNPWEQGELWHPGVTALTQRFLDDTGRNIDLDNLVTDSRTSVFSNYVIATKRYWMEWREIALDFFNYVETSAADGGGSPFLDSTSYGSFQGYPIKTFIQERFASLLLATRDFQVIAPDQGYTIPIYDRLFDPGESTRKLLLACDLMKSKYREHGDVAYLDMYRKLRAEVPFTGKTS